MEERWGRWIPDCRNKLLNSDLWPINKKLTLSASTCSWKFLELPWMQIEIQSRTKSWMETITSVSQNMWESRCTNANIYIKSLKNTMLFNNPSTKVSEQKCVQIWVKPRLSCSLHTQYRTERNDCEQHHEVFKIQRRGLLMEGEGDIQEEWQKSHLHHRASRSHWCFKHETQTFYLAEEVERTAEEGEELIRSNGWSGKRERWMDINDYVAGTESNRLQNKL